MLILNRIRRNHQATLILPYLTSCETKFQSDDLESINTHPDIYETISIQTTGLIQKNKKLLIPIRRRHLHKWLLFKFQYRYQKNSIPFRQIRAFNFNKTMLEYINSIETKWTLICPFRQRGRKKIQFLSDKWDNFNSSKTILSIGEFSIFIQTNYNISIAIQNLSH